MSAQNSFIGITNSIESEAQNLSTHGSSNRKWLLPWAIVVAALMVSLWTPMHIHAAGQIPPELSRALDKHEASKNSQGKIDLPKLNSAIKLYSDFIDKNKISPEAYNWRGMAYLDKGDYDSALADFDQALKLSGAYADAYNNRGEVYRYKNQPQKALEDYTKAIQYDKRFPEAHYNMGLVYESLKKPHEALEEFNKYLSFQPQNAPDRTQILTKIAELQAVAETVPKPQPKPKPKTEAAAGQDGWSDSTGPKSVKMPDMKMPGAGELMSAWASSKAEDPLSNILSLAMYVVMGLALFFMAKKTDTPLPWLGFIPIAQYWLMNSIARQPLWNFLLLFVPILGAILGGVLIFSGSIGSGAAVMILCFIAAMYAWFRISFGISSVMDGGTLWGILMFLPCTSIVAFIYFGFVKK